MLLVAKYNPVKTSKKSRRKIYVKFGAKIGAQNAQNGAEKYLVRKVFNIAINLIKRSTQHEYVNLI